MPKFLTAWLSRYAAEHLRTEVVELLKRNAELEARQPTLWGQFTHWLKSLLGSFVNRELRQENCRLQVAVQNLERRVDSQFDEISRLRLDLVKETVFSTRAARGQPTRSRTGSPYDAGVLRL